MTVRGSRGGGETSVPTTKALIIVGSGRSGSTLLAALLGSMPSFLPVGELGAIWGAAREDEACSCERPFSECPFWVAVGESAFGGWDQIDLDEMEQLNRQLVTLRQLPIRICERGQSKFHRYAERINAIHEAALAISGKSVVIDSTKSPAYARMLQRFSAGTLRVVHLVRDSRAVAYSWSRRVPIPERRHLNGDVIKVREPTEPLRAALEWLVLNTFATTISRTNRSSEFLRYETLVANPPSALRRVSKLAHVSDSPEDVEGLVAGEYESLLFHTVGGNRIRFLRGRIPIVLDDEWLQNMNAVDRLLVTVTTLPLLVRYGYSLFPRTSVG